MRLLKHHKYILAIGVVFIISHIFLAQAAALLPQGYFPYRDLLIKYEPKFLQPFASFDGMHYVLIAQEGYRQYEHAFFPLYPLLIAATHTLTTLSPLVIGFVLSSLFFLSALIFLAEALGRLFPKTNAALVIAGLLLFPTSFFFTALYTESLFLFLFSLTLWAAATNRLLLSTISGYLLGTTRLIGSAVSIITLGILYKKKWGARVVLPVAAPLFGLISYMYYLFIQTGDPVAFFNAQPAFGANRSTDLVFLPQVVYRYIKIFLTAQWNVQYFVALVEFLSLCLALVGIVMYYKIYLAQKKWRDTLPHWGFGLFSLANLLLPTLTGTLSSLPRYSLFTFTTFLVMPHLPRILRIVTFTVFALLHIVLFLLFSAGYFVS